MGVTLMLMPLQPGVEKTSSARVPAPPIEPKIRFIRPAQRRGGEAPTGREPAAAELEFGFWDNAAEGDPAPLDGFPDTTLLNAEEAEERNLVGGDTRRFHIVVEDPAASGRGAVDVDWWTAYKHSGERVDGVVQDDPGGVISLLETKAGSGVFVSKGLMLVSDAIDRAVWIHSGIPAGHPLAKQHGGLRKAPMSNYRIRRAGMFSFGVARYRLLRVGGPSTTVTAIVPVFVNTRRRIEVQVYVLRDKAGGSPSVPLAEIARDLRIVTQTYERHAVWLVTTVSPADLAVEGTTVRKEGSPIEYTILEVNPPTGTAQVTREELHVIAQKFPGQTNAMRLFYVDDILYRRDSNENVRGISFDTKPAPGDVVPLSSVGSSFVRLGRDPYTAAHELAHHLMPKATNEGHYLQRDRVDVTGARHIQSLNLLGTNRMGAHEHAQHTKRIWDLEDKESLKELEALYDDSPYVKK